MQEEPQSGWQEAMAPLPEDAILNSAKNNSGTGIHKVEIKGMKFDPENIIVKKGDTVVWENKDIFVHDITEAEKKEWNSGKLEAGQSWAKVIDKPADYFCSIHVVMKGKITLK